MTYPLNKVHIDIQFFLIKERWLRYWIDSRSNVLLGITKEQPLNFPDWWNELPELALPFTID